MCSKQVVLVTGASRGIGLAILRRFLSSKYLVIGTAVSAEGVEKIQSTIDESNGEGFSVRLNLGDSESISAVVKNLKKQDIQVDILVNNAGITRDNLALAMKPAQWQEVIDTNLSGTFLLTQNLLRPMLKKRYGRIINLSSIVGSTGNAGQVNYSASKAALEAMTKSLAQEISKKGVTVNAIAPGFIDTDMTAELSDELKAEMLKKIPAGVLGMPADISNCVGFLASEESRYITGQTIHVNGGLYM